MAAGNREHPRPRHVAVAVRDTHAVAIVRNVPAEHRGKTELPFDLAQDQHAAIRRQLSTSRNKIVRGQQEAPLTMTEATLFLPGLSPVGGKTITATFDALAIANIRARVMSRHE